MVAPDVPSQWHGSASIVAQNCVAYLFPDVLMTGVFVKPKYLVFMRNVMKYFGYHVSIAGMWPDLSLQQAYSRLQVSLSYSEW